MKKVKLIEVRSELGAGTRGASMGIDALRVACWDKGSDYFKRFNSVSVPDLNYTLFDKDLFPNAHRIDSILTVQKNIANNLRLPNSPETPITRNQRPEENLSLLIRLQSKAILFSGIIICSKTCNKLHILEEVEAAKYLPCQIV